MHAGDETATGFGFYFLKRAYLGFWVLIFGFKGSHFGFCLSKTGFCKQKKRKSRNSSDPNAPPTHPSRHHAHPLPDTPIFLRVEEGGEEGVCEKCAWCGSVGVLWCCVHAGETALQVCERHAETSDFHRDEARMEVHPILPRPVLFPFARCHCFRAGSRVSHRPTRAEVSLSRCMHTLSQPVSCINK